MASKLSGYHLRGILVDGSHRKCIRQSHTVIHKGGLDADVRGVVGVRDFIEWIHPLATI